MTVGTVDPWADLGAPGLACQALLLLLAGLRTPLLPRSVPFQPGRLAVSSRGDKREEAKKEQITT